MREKQLRIAIPGDACDVKNYVAAMKELGAEPVIVEADCDAADFDGLLLPGGVDVDPARYQEENTACGKISPELDARQFAVLDKFVQLKKPVLGICRGHQVVNVYFGGSLIQHIPCADRHARGSGDTTDKAHGSHAEAGSFVAALYGTDFPINSAHHQASNRIGKGLHVVQWSEEGVVEAAYHEALPVWSVQWHPERMCFGFAREDTVDGSKVLAFFLQQCGVKE